MLLLKAAELKLQGIDCQGKSQIEFYSTPFSKGRSFAKEDREKAVAICKKYLQADIVCLIVESQSKLTLWQEMKQPLPAAGKLPAKPSAAKYRNPRRARAESRAANINRPAPKV